MRLTLINQFYTPDISPTAHLAASVAEHRAALGDVVTVLTSRAGYLGAVGASSDPTGVRVRRLWSTRLGSRKPLRRLLDWLSFYPPALWAAVTLPAQDVVVVMTTPPFIALAGWLHILRNPSARLILWHMDTYPEALERTKLIKTGGAIAAVMRSIHRATFRRLDHLIALDAAMADLLLSQYAPPSRRVPHSIIPNWERAAMFPAGAMVKPWESPIADSLRGRFVVLYLGNAGYGHEFQTMIDAAEMLRDEPVTFLFVGGGSMAPWIADQCKQRKLGNILLHAYVSKEQTPAVMNRADCALITLEESMLGVMSPSKLHANLAMGLPILYVGPQRSNVDQAITRFKCGISLRPGAAAEFVNTIREWMRTPALHQECRQRARAAFEEAYCDIKTLPLFDRVVGSERLPPL